VNEKGCFNKYGIRSWESNHGCNNCSDDIIETRWFSNDLKRLSWIESFDFLSKCPNTYYGTNYNYYPSGFSCHGYASILFTLLFNDASDERIDAYEVGTYFFNYSDLEGTIKPADFIRLDDSHSALVVKLTKNGVEVLDNNSTYTANDNCMSDRRVIPFNSYYKVTITRATNRSDIHKCSYNSIGICDCGKTFPLTPNINSSLVGNWSRKLFYSRVIVRSSPYSASSSIANTPKSISVIHTVKNAWGNEWIYVNFTESGKCKSGYIYAPELTKTYNKKSSGASSTCVPTTEPSAQASTPYIYGVETTPVSGDRVKISWKASSPDMTFFVEYKNTLGAFVKDYDYTNNRKNSYVSSGIARVIEFRVRGTNTKWVYFTVSPLESLSSANAATPIAAPKNITVEKLGGGRAKISWESNCFDFEVQYLDRSNRWCDDPDFPSGTKSYITTNLCRNTQFRVRSTSSSGTSEWIEFTYFH